MYVHNSYSVPLTDGSTIASALVTEVVFSGMGPLYAPVGSTEPVSSVEPIRRDVESNLLPNNNAVPAIASAVLAGIGVYGLYALFGSNPMGLAALGVVLLITK